MGKRTGGWPEGYRKPVRDRETENWIQRTREGQGAGHRDRERTRVTGEWQSDRARKRRGQRTG